MGQLTCTRSVGRPREQQLEITKKRQTIDTEIDEFAFRCKHEFVYLYDVGRLFVHGEHPR